MVELTSKQMLNPAACMSEINKIKTYSPLGALLAVQLKVVQLPTVRVIFITSSAVLTFSCGYTSAEAHRR